MIPSEAQSRVKTGVVWIWRDTPHIYQPHMNKTDAEGFPKWAYAELSALPEGKGGGFIVKKYPERLKTVSAGDPLELMDADTPEDLEFLRNQ